MIGGVMPVSIPNNAVSDGGDLSAPSAELLRDLSLLPTAADVAKAGEISSAFTGSPSSVAVIEAGATALAKAWAAGLGALVASAWGSIAIFWTNYQAQRSVILWAVSIATAALVLAIGYIVGSDVRGRAAATVATYEARADVATAMLSAAREANKTRAAAVAEDWEVMALPIGLKVENAIEHGGNEQDWSALLLRSRGDKNEYWLVKGKSHRWVDAEAVHVV